MIRSAARKVGRTSPAAIEDAQLMFDEDRLGHDGTEAAQSDQSDQGDNQMNEFGNSPPTGCESLPAHKIGVR
jgi:hypothetical protein